MSGPTILVLGEHDVRELLDMESCVEAMAEALAALARGEVFQPLRSILAPPDASGMIGVMPTHRAGESPAYALKEIVVTPDNPTRGLDAHQGSVLLHDGSTGRLVAVLNASPVTEIRTAAVSGVATRALARPGSRRVAIVGAGVQARAHVASMRAVLDEPEIRLWARRPEAAAALASEVGAATSPSLEEALADADVVCTTTTAREPIVERRLLPPGIHVNAVGWTPGGRELDTDTVAGSTLFVDRRESTLNESGNYLLAAAEGAVGPDGIAAEVGEVLVGAHPGRRSDDEVTLFISMGIAVEDLAAAELVVRRALERGAGTEVAF